MMLVEFIELAHIAFMIYVAFILPGYLVKWTKAPAMAYFGFMMFCMFFLAWLEG